MKLLISKRTELKFFKIGSTFLEHAKEGQIKKNQGL